MWVIEENVVEHWVLYQGEKALKSYIVYWDEGSFFPLLSLSFMVSELNFDFYYYLFVLQIHGFQARTCVIVFLIIIMKKNFGVKIKL